MEDIPGSRPGKTKHCHDMNPLQHDPHQLMTKQSHGKKGWRDGSVAKNMYRSCREPQCGF